MNRLFKKTRLAVILVLFVGLLLGYVAALYKMQIYDALAGEVVALAPDSIASTRVDRARRGDVLDRNGVLLISSTATYNVALSWESLRAANYNEIVRELVHLAAEMGVGYNDTFPVTLGAPFSYRYDIAGKDQRRFEKYLEYFSLEPDITASDLVTWMKDHYKIPYTMGISDARLIIGVRYELEIRYIPGIADAIDPYIFAQDVGLGFVARLEEKTYPGVSVEVSSKREYFTQYAAHLLGYVSKITATQLETSKEQGLGYPLDAVVGQTGAEQAFEQYLRGTDGATSIRTAADGSVISEVLKSAPIPGQNVYLTIDIRVQEAAEKALASLIADINLTREDELNKVPGGAVVAVDVRSGEVLAMASYPTFDITTLLANFSELNADKSGPLYNRATQGTYTPGSTFKMVTALAGLRKGTITRWTQIYDSGIFTKYDNEVNQWFAPKCWLYNEVGVGHGALDVVGALQNSCNVFFYDVGDRTGVEYLNAAAADFGLGSKTGLEINERPGVLADEAYKLQEFGANEGWRAADNVLTAIGQGYSVFTPAQLANYIATIANGGVRHSLTLLKCVKSADYAATTYAQTPVVANVIQETEYLSYLQEGMRAVATSGTAANVFGNYQVKVAAKTGSVQATLQEFANGIFVCYAPADKPEIAVAVVVEKGGSGAAVMEIAKAVLDEYFDAGVTVGIPSDGALLP